MYQSGLVLEGGGNRGIFTSGVLDAFMENGLTFPYVIGVSAGSCNAASFLGKNLHRQHDITINYCRHKNYMGLHAYRQSGEYLNLGWIFGELSYDLMPLDYEAYEKSNAVLCAVVTNALTGKAEYFYPKDLKEFGCPVLRASCAMPLVTKGVVLDGVHYFDGGLADSIPLKRALEDGCRKAVLILTQDRDFVKPPIKAAKIMKLMYKKYPMLSQVIANRHIMYNDQRRYVEEQEKAGNVYVICPSKPLNCSSMENDTLKLESIYQLGYMQGKREIENIKRFLAEE